MREKWVFLFFVSFFSLADQHEKKKSKELKKTFFVFVLKRQNDKVVVSWNEFHFATRTPIDLNTKTALGLGGSKFRKKKKILTQKQKSGKREK